MTQLPLLEYERKHGVKLLGKLGDRKDGMVVQTNRKSAVKFFYEPQVYAHESRAYRIIRSEQIDEVLGHQVPQLLEDDDELRAIEMSIVSPPFLLDLAAAYSRDEVEHFGFTEEVMAERMEHWSEVFGDRWQAVLAVRDTFERLTGLVLLDLSLNNIRFE